MINLKSEIFKKTKEVKELKSQSSTVKAATLKGSSSSVNKKVPSWLKKNVGINKRNEKDLLEINEEDKQSQVQAILQAKSKMYDRMTSGDFIPDGDDTQVFLVDFEQKSIDAWRDRSEKGDKNLKPEVNIKVASEVVKTLDDAKDQWIEYKDSLGRTRTCLKEELPRLQKQDEKLNLDNSGTRSLMSDDMRREEERKKWEETAIEDLQNELHYENLRFGEVRELGVGYFAFSGKQEERDEQMKRLDQLRKETERRKQENVTKKQKQQTMLAARLEKVRQRRIKQLKAQGKEIPASLLEPVQLEPVITETTEIPPQIPESQPNEIASDDPTSSKTREWDKGKDDWQPAKAPTAPKSWVNPRNERPSEFAPPSFYYPTSNETPDEEYNPPIKQVKQETVEVQDNPPSSDNERIERLLAEVKSQQKCSSDEKPPVVPNSNTNDIVEPVTTPTPYVPSNKPISMKLMSKPTKLLNNNKSTLDL